MTKTKDPKMLAVMNLLRTKKEIDAAKVALETATAKPRARLEAAQQAYAAAEDVVKSMLPSGSHAFGKWIVRIYDEVKKGRASPSWKGIAEHISGAISKIETGLLTEFETPYHEPILVFGQKARAAYEEGKILNTKPAISTTTTMVELTENIQEPIC